jgi:hypothetical protein
MTTEIRTCRVCGCTDDDCSGCIERTGRPCWWVSEDLCSACAELVIRVKHGAATNVARVVAPKGCKAQASSSSGPETAALRLAEKLYPDAVGALRLEKFEDRLMVNAPVVEFSFWRIAGSIETEVAP